MREKGKEKGEDGGGANRGREMDPSSSLSSPLIPSSFPSSSSLLLFSFILHRGSAPSASTSDAGSEATTEDSDDSDDVVLTKGKGKEKEREKEKEKDKRDKGEGEKRAQSRGRRGSAPVQAQLTDRGRTPVKEGTDGGIPFLPSLAPPFCHRLLFVPFLLSLCPHLPLHSRGEEVEFDESAAEHAKAILHEKTDHHPSQGRR